MKAKRALHISIWVIALSSIAVYSNALSNGFVYDDLANILDNHFIRAWSSIPDIFSKGVWGFYDIGSSFYRPMMHVIYLVVFKLSGLSPFAFHTVNVIFHSGVCILVFLITREMLAGIYPGSRYINIAAAGAAVVFAVHPIHTEAVAWVSAVPDLSYSFFLLLSLYCFIKWRKMRSGYNALYAGSVFSFFVATLCKEPAVVLPFLIFFYDISFSDRDRKFTETLKRLIPYLLALSVYFAMRVNALGGFAPPNINRHLSSYEAITNVFPLLGKYILKLFVPTELNVFHVFKPYASIFEPAVVLSLAIAILMTIIAVVSLKKDKGIFFSIILFITPLLPALYIPALGRNAFTERYLYLPSFGFAFLVAVLLVRTFDRGKKSGIALASAIIAIIAVFSVATYERNRIWKNEFTLWYDTVQKSPDAAIPHDALGNTYFRMGKMDEAIEQYNMALRIQPSFPRAVGNLGNAYNKKGELDKAVEQYRLAISLNPKDENFHNNLGIAYAKSGKLDDALSEFQTAIGINPYYSDGFNNLGLAYKKMGMRDKALEAFKKAVSLKPENDSYRRNLERV